MTRSKTPIETPPKAAPPIGHAHIVVRNRLQEQLAALAHFDAAYKSCIMVEEPFQGQFPQQLVKTYSLALRETRRIALAIRKMARAEVNETDRIQFTPDTE